MLEGEREAFLLDKLVVVPLHKTRRFSGFTPEDLHFRLAESQFLRMCAHVAVDYEVHQVDVIINPKLVTRYDRMRRKAAAAAAATASSSSDPIEPSGEIEELLMFHGTSAATIPLIAKDGFKVGGGDDGVQVKNGAAYGKGVYLSEDPAFAMRYIRSAQSAAAGPQLLFAKCLMTADVRRVPDPKTPALLQQVVVPNKDQVLPFYVVHLRKRN